MDIYQQPNNQLWQLKLEKLSAPSKKVSTYEITLKLMKYHLLRLRPSQLLGMWFRVRTGASKEVRKSQGWSHACALGRERRRPGKRTKNTICDVKNGKRGPLGFPKGWQEFSSMSLYSSLHGFK